MIQFSLHARVIQPEEIVTPSSGIVPPGVAILSSDCETAKLKLAPTPDSNPCPHLSPPKSKNEHPFEPNTPHKTRRSSLPISRLPRAPCAPQISESEQSPNLRGPQNASQFSPNLPNKLYTLPSASRQSPTADSRFSLLASCSPLTVPGNRIGTKVETPGSCIVTPSRVGAAAIVV